MQENIELTVTIESGEGPTLVARCEVPWEVAVPIFNAAADHAVAQSEAFREMVVEAEANPEKMRDLGAALAEAGFEMAVGEVTA